LGKTERERERAKGEVGGEGRRKKPYIHNCGFHHLWIWIENAGEEPMLLHDG
ncbi:unnamed protein product, partial [Schistosoma haematobium]